MIILNFSRTETAVSHSLVIYFPLGRCVGCKKSWQFVSRVIRTSKDTVTTATSHSLSLLHFRHGEDPAMEEGLSSPSTLQDSDGDHDYTPLSQHMDTSNNEDDQLLMKRGWREDGGEGEQDDSEASGWSEIPTWLLPARRQRAITSTQSRSAP